ncbi:MAG TPA: PIF1 family DEAD/DEAH box helicase [Candidatus Paceibacterota bacterium]|nr:PIF1 family DEAD/DEAH box helicase [Candidatus Paceibacterota bacterium]
MTQDLAFEILKTGANVFLTGEPGAGKTHTINRYIAYLREQGIEPAVCASTGIAATHIGGYTIHSWSGIGVKPHLTEYDLDQIAQKEKVVKRVRLAKVLIIDEISMLSADTLDMVDLVMRTLRGREEAFGGVQVIFVGDFFQLPPVVKAVQSDTLEISYDEPRSPFAFHAKSWKDANLLPCYLEEQHRQEDDEFLLILSAMRRGDVPTALRKKLESRVGEPPAKNIHTKLFPHNANVDRLNDAELQKIPGLPRRYDMRSKGAPPLVEALKRNCLSPETLLLKVGAKIMFTKNDPEGEYYNGTLGEVREFSKLSGNPIVKLKAGGIIEVESVEWAVQDGHKKLATIEQLPLRLAWAITVHKSQGMSLDSAVIDLSQAFEYGQGYVALSRVRTLDGLHLLGFNERALEVHPEVLERDMAFREQSEAAADAFTAMDQKELDEMHERFIRAALV